MAIGSTLRGTAGDSSAQDLREIVKLLQNQNDAKTKRDDELKKLITELFGDQKDSESKEKESKNKRTRGKDKQPRKRKGTDKEKGNAKRDRSQPEKSNAKDDKKKAKSNDAFAKIMNQSGSAVQSTMSTFASLNSVVDMSHIQMNDFSTKAIAGATSSLSKGFTAALTKGAMRLNPYTLVVTEAFNLVAGKALEFYQFMNEGAVNLQAFNRETGVSVGGQQGLRVAQAQSQLSLSELANVVDKGSRAFASFGKKELKMFTKQVGQLANSDLRMLGVASEDVANLMRYQLEQDRNRFAFDTKSRHTSNEASKSYIQTMIKMSKVTGKTAEEMAKISSGADLDQATKHLADQAQEMAYAAGIAADMTEDEARASAQEQRAAMMSMAEEMSGGDKELMESLIKRAVTGVDDALTSQIASVGAGDFLNDWTTAVQEGALDADAAVALSKEHGSTIQQVSKELALISPELSNALGSVYNGLTVYADGVEKLQDSRTLLDVWESAITGWTSTATTTMSTAWTTFVQELFAIDGSLWGNISNAFSEAWKILKEGFANLFPDLSGMFDFDFFGDDDTPEETSKKEKERIDNAGKYQQGSYAPPASSATVYGYGMQTQYPPKVAEQAEKNIQAETKKAEIMMHESVVPEVNAIEVERKNALAKEQSMDVLKTANIGEKTGNAYVDQDKLNNWLDKKTIPEVERKLSQYLDLVFDESKRMLGYQDQYYINMAAGIQDHLSTRLGDLEGTPSFHQQAMTEEVKPASFSDSLISNAPSVMTVEPINTPLVEPPLAAPVQQVQEPIVQEVLTRDDVRSEVQGAMKDQSREQETQNRLDADAIGKAVAAELRPEMQQTNSYMAMQVGLVEDGNRQLRKNGNGGIRPVN